MSIDQPDTLFGQVRKPISMAMQPFPKITGKHGDFLSNLRQLKQQHTNLTDVINLEGTVKLHGMHADMVFDLSAANSSPHFQSRNRILLADEDCSGSGWPCSLTSLPQSGEALQDLKRQILQRFSNRNFGFSIKKSSPLVIAGEWIGENMQPDTALRQLSKRFVILGIRINKKWQHDSDFADIELPEFKIFSIFRGQQSKVAFSLDDISKDNPALLQIQRLADMVESCCPFAQSFGINHGHGEGVVWKPGTPAGRADAKYWLKTKGPLSGPENRIDLAVMAFDKEKKKSIEQICSEWLTPRRIEQGFEALLSLIHI